MSQKKIISNIQKVRSLNNKYWMDILRVAFKYAPVEASKIIKKINVNDKKISALISKLSK
jgi:predicted transcriptional regulator